MHQYAGSFASLVMLLTLSMGCQSLQKSLLDDDCTSTRLTFWDNETDTELPSPRLASAEALKWMTENDAQLLAAHTANPELDQTMAGDFDAMDWSASKARVFVPEMLEREHDSRRNNPQVAQTERRKPLFSKAVFGVQATSIGIDDFGTPQALAARGPLARNGEQMETYVVASGDTLGVISKKIYGTSGRWMELAHLNNLGDGSLIYPKEILFYIKDTVALGRR